MGSRIQTPPTRTALVPPSPVPPPCVDTAKRLFFSATGVVRTFRSLPSCFRPTLLRLIRQSDVGPFQNGPPDRLRLPPMRTDGLHRRNRIRIPPMLPTASLPHDLQYLSVPGPHSLLLPIPLSFPSPSPVAPLMAFTRPRSSRPFPARSRNTTAEARPTVPAGDRA